MRLVAQKRFPSKYPSNCAMSYVFFVSHRRNMSGKRIFVVTERCIFGTEKRKIFFSHCGSHKFSPPYHSTFSGVSGSMSCHRVCHCTSNPLTSGCQSRGPCWIATKEILDPLLTVFIERLLSTSSCPQETAPSTSFSETTLGKFCSAWHFVSHQHIAWRQWHDLCWSFHVHQHCIRIVTAVR